MAGKSYRKGLTLFDVIGMFPDETAAKKWLSEQRWDDVPTCPYCHSDNVQSDINHSSMTHRCRDCEDRPMFSVRTGTIMEGSNLKYRIWAVGIYLFTTNIKGISSLKLHRELGISQKAAWFMLHRLRKAFELEVGVFSGPVETDETYIGGKEKNKHVRKRRNVGRGGVGKEIVIGAKDRKTNKISAGKIACTDQRTLHNFVHKHTEKNAAVYTDDHKGYSGLSCRHETVRHSVSEYVRNQAHTNGIESFWALLKRGYHGIHHHMSEKHLNRYVQEFAGRHNIREQDTVEQMAVLAKGMTGKRLKYHDLIA